MLLACSVLRLSLTHPSKFSQVFSWTTRPGHCRRKPRVSGGCDVACAPKTSYWRPGGQIHWSQHLELSAASSCLVSRQCWISFCTYLRTSCRAGMARGRPGISMDSSFLPLFTCNLASPWSPWVCATDASGGARGGYGGTRPLCDPK